VKSIVHGLLAASKYGVCTPCSELGYLQ